MACYQGALELNMQVQPAVWKLSAANDKNKVISCWIKAKVKFGFAPCSPLKNVSRHDTWKQRSYLYKFTNCSCLSTQHIFMVYISI